MSSGARADRRRSILMPLKRLSGFSASIILSTIIGVFTIPLLVRALGADTWASIGVLQTTGQLAAVFVAFGWGATGPSIAASTAPAERVDFYRHSFRIRGVLYLAAVPVVAVLLFFLLRGDILLAVLGAVVYVLPGLGAGWYFTGVARPMAFFLCEAVPSSMGAVAGVIAATVTQQAWVVPACQLVGSGTAVLLSYRLISRGRDRNAAPAVYPRFWASLQAQRHAMTTGVTSAVYVAMPVLMVTVFFPSALPVYSIADRFLRYASIAFLPIQQFFQGWVPSEAERVDRRAKIALLAGVVVGVVGGACIAVLSPIVSVWFGIHVPFEVSLPLGIAFVGVALSGLVGYACLVVLGQTRFLARSTVIGAVIGIPALIVTAAFHSLPAVAASVAGTELIVAAVQIIVMLSALRQRRHTVAA